MREGKAKPPTKQLVKTSDTPEANTGGGAPGEGASRGKIGDGIGLTIIFLGKRHSNMAKRAK